YENADGTSFNWEEVDDPAFAGYNTMSPADRAVLFLRDTQDESGAIIKQHDGAPLQTTVQDKVKALLGAASAGASAKYLPYGNEARIKKAYASRDSRLSANVITPYAGIVGGYNYSSAGNAMEVFWRWPISGGNATPNTTQRDDMAVDNANHFSYYHRKFVYEGAGLADRNNGPIDEPLIRYADVLLMWAEALVELNQLTGTNGAEGKVAQVRSRVNMPTLPSNFASKEKARDYVRDERRREFVNEGINFFDEMRWRTWKESKFKFSAGEKGQTETVWGATGNAGSYKWAGDQLYVWPVPQTEIEKNPNLKATPGWNY
ncbi:RagB/SusD family nutrient uptake outer membrane protein, partial [termite gut metagenome]